MKSYEGAKVVVVDDIESVIEGYKSALATEDIETIGFSDPEKAIEYLKENRVDVILLDYFMPNFNGNEFVKELREFDKETVVILQTGYADKLPPLDTMKELNIQGYFDKNKSMEDLILMIISSLKTVALAKKVKEQEIQLDAKDYQNAFLGKFLNRLMGEISERGMAMAGSIVHLEEMKDKIPENERELFVNSVENIQYSISRLNDLIKSIEIGEENIVAKDLKNILNRLFEMTFTVKDITFNFNMNNEYQLLNCNAKILAYILVDIIEFLISIDEKDIVFEVQDETTIKVCNKIEDKELLNKINKLAIMDNKIKIKNVENQIYIIY